jgi:hypothetical protein
MVSLGPLIVHRCCRSAVVCLVQDEDEENQDILLFQGWPGPLRCEGRAIQRQSSWCAGLACLSRSSNQPNEADQRNQMNQLPATRREMVRVIHSRLSVSSEVQGQELTLVFYPGFWATTRKQLRARRSQEWKWYPCLGFCFGC